MTRQQQFLIVALVLALSILHAGVAAGAIAPRPVRVRADGTVSRVIAADCRVHVLNAAGDESVHPCGVALSLPSGAETLWIEQGDAISGQVSLPLDAAASDLLLVPAGEVTLPAESKARPRQRVRVIHAGTTRFAREFRADIRVDNVAQALRVPAGQAVAFSVDDHGDVVGIAAARASSVRSPTLLHPEAPARGAAVVGFFSVPDLAEHADPPAEPDRFLLGGSRTPELILHLPHEIVAIWRDLQSGPTELTLQSGVYRFAPVPLRLQERRITTFRGELRPLPNIAVTVDIPEEFRTAWLALEPTLTIRRPADRKIIRQAPATMHQEFRHLPAETYEVVLHSKPWDFVRRANLSDGQDGAIAFALAPFTVKGRVTIGDDPADASVTFRRSAGDLQTVHTDADHEYAVTLWAGSMYLIQVTPDHAASDPPYAKLVRLTSEEELDIRIPRTDVVVSVVDAATKKPVPHAQVAVFNAWTDPVAGKSRASHLMTTDASGRARLAPMNPGTAEIDVTADGYFKDAPTTVPVEENGEERVVQIRVRAAGAGPAVRIVLPQGAPAAGAEVLVVADPAGERVLWSGSANDRGEIEVPASLEQAIVLVRHPAAAGFARRFQNLPDQEYRLSPLSSQPLLAHVERQGAPARQGAVTIWFNGIPLSWSALQFLINASPSVSPIGTWTAGHLPAGPLRILASSGAVDAAIAAGAFDALATTLPEPRPSEVSLRSVD